MNAVTDQPQAAGSITSSELVTQPETWRRVASTPQDQLALLPKAGEKVLVLGCGTSYYIGEAYARRRIAAGLGPTRAEIPSELDHVDADETIILLSRSGTTGDLITVGRELGSSHRLVGIVGAAGTPVTEVVDDVVLLDYADETSLMQTRFATSGLSLLRRSLGEDLTEVIADGERALAAPSPLSPEAFERLQHVVFLGTLDSAAIAQEAALKVREGAGFWTEAYPLHEYQHGPISCASERSLVWTLCEVPDWVADDILATGATLERGTLDPQAELVRIHRFAVDLALREGRNPDSPPHLSRSVQLQD